jgi:hypothetical protein
MNRRKNLVDNWILMPVKAGWEPCYEHGFRILYGLPAQIQIELACFMIRRYLPLLKAADINLEWLPVLLNDVGKWVEEFGQVLPLREDTFRKPGQGQLGTGLGALMEAYYYRNDPFALTHSAIYAAMSSIHARATTIWAADDPEAVEMCQTPPFPRERTALWNVASIAVSQREWQFVGEWLKRERVWTYPDKVDIEKMEYELAAWLNAQCLLIGPIFSHIKPVPLEERIRKCSESQQKFRELGYI